LDKLQDALFSAIPGLPAPSQIDHIVVTIAEDLTATAIVNELQAKAQIKVNRAIGAGEPVFVRDIDDVAAVDLGIEIAPDVAVVVMRSSGWKRSVFYDFTPLDPDGVPREGRLDAVLAKPWLLLLGLPVGAPQGAGSMTRADLMALGVADLERLLGERCEEESKYQELLHQHPWMLGGSYGQVLRHQPFDDSAIPDFTAVRCYDQCHDIIELKQPFLQLFKGSDQFGAAFNDAWNQAEGYLAFTMRQRGYLLQEKKLRFEDPRVLLICGHGLNPEQLARVRERSSVSRTITVITYDQILEIARHFLALVRAAGDRPLPSGAS